MRILPYEEFEHTINALRDNIDQLDKVAEVLDCANIFNLSASDQVTDLLTYIFDDKDEWISYWVYERDFGRNWYEGCAQEKDGSNIDLSTTKRLYDFLVSNLQG